MNLRSRTLAVVRGTRATALPLVAATALPLVAAPAR